MSIFTYYRVNQIKTLILILIYSLNKSLTLYLKSFIKAYHKYIFNLYNYIFLLIN
jgi:hypothetical protein